MGVGTAIDFQCDSGLNSDFADVLAILSIFLFVNNCLFLSMLNSGFWPSFAVVFE